MRKIILFFVILATTTALFPNNIKVENATIGARDPNTKTRLFTFDLSWDNSWRNDLDGQEKAEPYNWDAAWVFVKYLRFGKSYEHATLSTDSSKHTAPLGCKIKPSADGKGVFIYRSQNGSGSIDFNNIKLQWNYGQDFDELGAESADSIVGFQIYAIEMVYVPKGEFYVGDPAGQGGPTNCFYSYPNNGTFRIGSEGAINYGKTTDYLYSNWNTALDDKVIPAEFPKGYNAFYVMKYEGTNQQYVDFLNSLTLVQQDTRDNNISPNSFNGVRGGIVKNGQLYETSHPDRAINNPTHADVLAYLSWSGLRLMTELEYEKACRGGNMPIANEYAWGSAQLFKTSDGKRIIYSNSTDPYEDGAETLNDSVNCHIEYTSHFYKTDNTSTLGYGPLRSGIFAKANSNRLWSGATYYGIMEMSGNLQELVVNIYSPQNFQMCIFDGSHGDGKLNIDGSPTFTSFTNEYDLGVRGGSWASSSSFGMIARRAAFRYDYWSIESNFSLRGIRTAP